MAEAPDNSKLQLKTSVKAIIIEDGRLLTMRKSGKHGESCVAPGGTHRPGETLVEGLEREVFEELGAHVEVGPLRHVRDYIGRNHEFADVHGDLHRVEFWFECRLIERPGTHQQSEPDKRQVGVEWLDLADLADKPFYPRAMAAILQGAVQDPPRYLGDVN